MREPVKKILNNGTVFLIKPLPFDTGMANFCRLVSFAGPAISSLKGKIDGDTQLNPAKIMEDLRAGEIPVDMILDVVGGVLKNMSNPDIPRFCVDMLQGLSVYNASGIPEPVEVNSYFSGNYGEARQIVVEACKVNFESFLEGMGLQELFSLASVENGLAE